MQNASLAGFLHLTGSPFSIPLDASHYHWQQHVDHRGRPRSKVRAGRWSFATSLLDEASYQHLLALMLSATTVSPRQLRPRRRAGRLRHGLGPQLHGLPRPQPLRQLRHARH